MNGELQPLIELTAIGEPGETVTTRLRLQRSPACFQRSLGNDPLRDVSASQNELSSGGALARDPPRNRFHPCLVALFVPHAMDRSD